MLRINSKILNKALEKVFPAIPSKAINDIHECFYFQLSEENDTAIIKGTDGQVSLETEAKSISIEQECEFFVNAKMLNDLVKTLGDTDLYFKKVENQIEISFESGKYKVSLVESEFLGLEEVQYDKWFNIESSLLSEALTSTSFCISKETVRPSMTGVLLDFTQNDVNFVATDGHRLVKYTVNQSMKENAQYIIPERSVLILQKLLTTGEVTVNLCKSYAEFIIGDVKFQTRLIMERFPSYESVIPKDTGITVKANIQDVLTICKRQLGFSNSLKEEPTIKLTIAKDKMIIESDSIATGSKAKETVQLLSSTGEMTIAFKTNYLIDELSHLEGTEFTMDLISPTKAAIIKSTQNKDCLMLLMPKRLSA